MRDNKYYEKRCLEIGRDLKDKINDDCIVSMFFKEAEGLIRVRIFTESELRKEQQEQVFTGKNEKNVGFDDENKYFFYTLYFNYKK